LILHHLISDSTPDNIFSKILFTLWYIWKARKDKLFHQKTWIPMQVHNAVAAHINTHTQAILPLSSITSTGDTAAWSMPAQQGDPTHAQSGMTISLHQVQMTNRYRIATPTLLQGSRCYVDASTVPDQLNSQPRMAGLGIFILNF
jgi:hypothetical protein